MSTFYPRKVGYTMRSISIDPKYKCVTFTKIHDRGQHIGHFYTTPPSYNRLLRVSADPALNLKPAIIHGDSSGEILLVEMGRN